VPTTVLGQLARGLEGRRRAGAGPLTVASCDNLPSNGRLLRSLVGEMLELPGRFDPGLAEWTAANVSFPCSMVDRIVPASTHRDADRARAALGLDDEAPVVAEPFFQWVVEDAFTGPRPPLELGGAQLVPDVGPYETLKLRVLNGSHSALAYLGALAGLELVAESVAEPAFAALARKMVDEEVTPTLAVPAGVAVGSYRDEVLERFANPLLAHRNLQVAADGSQKLPQRVLATVRARLAAGAEPRLATLVVAAYVRAICHARDERGCPFEVSDPLAPELRRQVEGARGPAAVAARVLGVEALFGADLGGDEAFRRLLAEALAELSRAPVRQVAASYAGS
ncbi:MAG: mannitol dehydrogenase family protein, partial [Acidimicrobiales bacterium]